jgi:hypothetical protein
MFFSSLVVEVFILGGDVFSFSSGEVFILGGDVFSFLG